MVSLLPEPIVLELADQWGSVLVGETLLLATSDNDAGVLFSNGSNQIELQNRFQRPGQRADQRQRVGR